MVRGLTLDQMNSYYWTRADVTPAALLEPTQWPKIRAFYLMNVFAHKYYNEGGPAFENTRIYDRSGLGHHLDVTGLALTDLGLSTTWPGCMLPYLTFDGANDYAYVADADGVSITGDMTIWAIVWPNAISNPAIQGIVSKFLTTGNARSFALYLGTGNRFTLRISQDGGSTNMVDVSSAALTSAQSWHFVCGRFDAGTSHSMFLDGTWVTVTARALASIYDNARELQIGQYNESATNRFAGRIAQVGICAYHVPDEQVEAFYAAIRPDLGHV